VSGKFTVLEHDTTFSVCSVIQDHVCLHEAFALLGCYAAG